MDPLKTVCLSFALALSSSCLRAEDAYRAVDGKPYPMTDPAWTFVQHHIRVEAIGVKGTLTCVEYTTEDVHGQANVGAGRGKVAPQSTGHTVIHWGMRFVLKNYPEDKWRRAAVGQDIPNPIKMMRVAGDLYDYGIPWAPPVKQLTEDEKKKLAAEQKTKSSAAQEKAFKYYQDQVAGDPKNDFAQYKLGMCYLKGEGVEADPAKAKEHISAAAVLGNSDAARELKKLGQ
jgi:hypothetical protein